MCVYKNVRSICFYRTKPLELIELCVTANYAWNTLSAAATYTIWAQYMARHPAGRCEVAAACATRSAQPIARAPSPRVIAGKTSFCALTAAMAVSSARFAARVHSARHPRSGLNYWRRTRFRILSAAASAAAAVVVQRRNKGWSGIKLLSTQRARVS